MDYLVSGSVLVGNKSLTGEVDLAVGLDVARLNVKERRGAIPAAFVYSVTFQCVAAMGDNDNGVMHGFPLHDQETVVFLPQMQLNLK